MKSISKISTNFITYFGLVVIYSLFIACTPKNSSDNTDNGIVDATDRRQCSGPATNFSPFTSWSQHLNVGGNGQSIIKTYTITNNLLTLSTICGAPGSSTAVSQLHAGIDIFGGRMTIRAAQHETVLSEDGTVSCTGDIPAETWTYRLVGGCIEFSQPGGRILMLPRTNEL